MGIMFLSLHRSNYIRARNQFTTTYLYKIVAFAFSIPEDFLLIIFMPGTLFCLVQNPEMYFSCMIPTTNKENIWYSSRKAYP